MESNDFMNDLDHITDAVRDFAETLGQGERETLVLIADNVDEVAVRIATRAESVGYQRRKDEEQERAARKPKGNFSTKC